MGSKTLLEKCEECFDTRDFYEVLEVQRNASAKEIKKAYYKLSLIVHPDRVEEQRKASATEKFKVLSRIHAILQDEEKRKVYDECGDFDEENDASCNWLNYWRSMFKKITVEDITNYKTGYIGSEKERVDIRKAYVNGKGSMDFLFEMVPFSDCENEPRIVAIVQQMVDDGEVERYECFFNEPKRKKQRRMEKWKREAEEIAELNVSAEDLEKQIQKKQEERMSFFEKLEQKYCSPKKTATKRKAIKAEAAPKRKQPSRSTRK